MFKCLSLNKDIWKAGHDHVMEEKEPSERYFSIEGFIESIELKILDKQNIFGSVNILLKFGVSYS